MIISVLGCGWLGLPLAKYLIDRNHTLKGSTTTKNKIETLKNYSIEPYLLKLDPALSAPESVRDFWKSDALVLNIPPGRNRDNIIIYHTRQIEAVSNAIKNSPLKHLVFISSTSVYPKNSGLVTEKSAIPGKAGRDSGNALLQAEQLLMDSENFKTTVLRFGGLYGGDRHPAKYMAGRTSLSKGNAPVNLIHRDDCIAIITQIIEEKITGEVFNAVSDGHPTRREYYTKAAEALELEPPTFDKDLEKQNYKMVSNKKLKKKLNYSFIYPEPTISFQS